MHISKKSPNYPLNLTKFPFLFDSLVNFLDSFPNVIIAAGPITHHLVKGIILGVLFLQAGQTLLRLHETSHRTKEEPGGE